VVIPLVSDWVRDPVGVVERVTPSFFTVKEVVLEDVQEIVLLQELAPLRIIQPVLVEVNDAVGVGVVVTVLVALHVAVVPPFVPAQLQV
jgi:hypothetical protein